MIKLLTAVHGHHSVIRSYSHHEFGLLPIVTVLGAPGCADVVHLFIGKRDAAYATAPAKRKRKGRARSSRGARAPKGGNLPPAA
jgi:hypothetical protein